jgi:hypothetical protein
MTKYIFIVKQKIILRPKLKKNQRKIAASALNINIFFSSKKYIAFDLFPVFPLFHGVKIGLFVDVFPPEKRNELRPLQVLP